MHCGVPGVLRHLAHWWAALVGVQVGIGRGRRRRRGSRGGGRRGARRHVLHRRRAMRNKPSVSKPRTLSCMVHPAASRNRRRCRGPHRAHTSYLHIPYFDPPRFLHDSTLRTQIPRIFTLHQNPQGVVCLLHVHLGKKTPTRRNLHPRQLPLDPDNRASRALHASSSWYLVRH
ncbi:hypothetical protein BKA70DRAFT_681752 [Coprinopsis sp. MPI-PUGE-AT-0042]|nr:hypothetical protein BKA70DRAFT_681752 [Coprinopsis sp. MPI-PUGE-AT-0042]